MTRISSSPAYPFCNICWRRKKVNELTKQLVIDGYELIDGPRWTGDGYYESVILDPEKNRIEITM